MTDIHLTNYLTDEPGLVVDIDQSTMTRELIDTESSVVRRLGIVSAPLNLARRRVPVDVRDI